MYGILNALWNSRTGVRLGNDADDDAEILKRRQKHVTWTGSLLKSHSQQMAVIPLVVLPNN
jgi:hypothetical protein